jgi:hypothetical protein
MHFSPISSATITIWRSANGALGTSRRLCTWKPLWRSRCSGGAASRCTPPAAAPPSPLAPRRSRTAAGHISGAEFSEFSVSDSVALQLCAEKLWFQNWVASGAYREVEDGVGAPVLERRQVVRARRRVLVVVRACKRRRKTQEQLDGKPPMTPPGMPPAAP